MFSFDLRGNTHTNTQLKSVGNVLNQLFVETFKLNVEGRSQETGNKLNV